MNKELLPAQSPVDVNVGDAVELRCWTRLRYDDTGERGVKPGSIELLTVNGLYHDDGNGNMVDDHGTVCGSIDYTAGTFSIDA